MFWYWFGLWVFWLPSNCSFFFEMNEIIKTNTWKQHACLHRDYIPLLTQNWAQKNWIQILSRVNASPVANWQLRGRASTRPVGNTSETFSNKPLRWVEIWLKFCWTISCGGENMEFCAHSLDLKRQNEQGRQTDWQSRSLVHGRGAKHFGRHPIHRADGTMRFVLCRKHCT